MINITNRAFYCYLKIVLYVFDPISRLISLNKKVVTTIKKTEWVNFSNKLQSPFKFLRTYDVTHSRFVTHFRILKNS